MKNYQQALHDADVLCRSKPHWPAVRCSPLAEAKIKNASARGFSLCQGQCCWGCCWKNRAKNVSSTSKNKSGRSSESLQLVGFWWWAAGGVVLFVLVPIICYSLCCSLASESVHKAPAAQDGPAGPSGMLCPQEACGFNSLLTDVFFWRATHTVYQGYFLSLFNPKISYLWYLPVSWCLIEGLGFFS